MNVILFVTFYFISSKENVSAVLVKHNNRGVCVSVEGGSVQSGHHLVRDVLQTHEHSV